MELPRPSVPPATGPVLLARLGSRLTIVPEPGEGRLRVLPLGLHLPEIEGLSLDVRVAGAGIRFPQELPPGTRVTVLPTSVAYRMPVPGRRADVTLEILSPFTPGSMRWRDAPVMLLSVSVRNRGPQPVRADVRLRPFEVPGVEDRSRGDVVALAATWRFALRQTRPSDDLLRRGIAPHLAARPPASPSGDIGPPGTGLLLAGGARHEGWRAARGALHQELELRPGEEARREVAVLFHTASPVHVVDGTLRSFAYVDAFPSAMELLRDAVEARQELRLHDRRAVGMMLLAGEPESVQRLGALGLQTFLANTWLLRDPASPPRYSEWEGYPRFHATLDVAYNNAPFYVLFAPDLLASMLRHWPRYAAGGHMPHDMGQGLVIGATAYPSRMPVEEDASFLLLHYLHATFTGDTRLLAEQRGLLRSLAEALLDADEDGNGLPDRGVTNTFDDAPWVVNAAPNQLYLGIKAAAALHAYVALSPATDLPPELEARISRRLELVASTVERSWQGRHYPTVVGDVPAGRRRILSPVPRSLRDATGTAGAPGAADADPRAPSNYLAHGLVPLLWTGDMTLPAAFPHLAEHLRTAHARTATPYGDAHTPGSTNVWVSQNLWRDAGALFLGAGLDVAAQADRYWSLQLAAHARKAREPWWEGFCDSPVNPLLTSYGRGTSVLLLPWARRGITFSRGRGVLDVPAAARRGRLDLPFLARWQENRVPSLTWEGKALHPSRRGHPDLLAGIDVP